MTGWAVLAHDEVWEVCPTMAEADAVAMWLVSAGHALVATVQPYDEDGPYLPVDHGQ